MGKRDPRVDAYLGKAPAFAKPILAHVRALVHEACPDVEETLKWSVPHFEHRGVLCGMAAFRQHCNIILWKGALIPGGNGRDEKGNFRNITSLADLPSDKSMLALFEQAARLNEEGVKSPRRKRATASKPVSVPAELATALARNKKAAAAFEKFPPSHKREYAQWIAEAKGEETRQRRVKSAIGWIAAGKARNWKYEKR
ncbi:MAG TPA: YdeI/OmpD-associated family protein [Gemmatimonadaceae bacterium]|nr:YdeI/OmpD-associated family protein [Gemmatimonadaceae bacterium]